MSTPAINVSNNGYSNRDRSFWWGADGPYTSQESTYSSAYNRQRPASVSNPVRPDRTRPPSPFHHYWWAARAPLGVFDAKQGSTRVLVQGPYGHLPRKDILFGSGYTPALYDRAVMSYLKNLKNSEVDLGVALAEARKTAELLGKNTTSLANSLDKFMSRNASKLGKMLSWKKIPGRYLEWCYGVTPLLNDIDGSAKALSEMVELGYDLSYTTRGSAHDEWIVTEKSAQYDTGVPLYYECSIKESRYISCVNVMPDNLLPVFSSLGLTNPATVVWELVPYSFVLDWVVPIGGWLEVLDAGAFSSFREGSFSSIQRIEGTNYEVGTLGSPWVVSECSGQFVVRGGRFDRSVLYANPAPPIFPRLRSPLSLDKMAKGLSLLTSVFAKWK